MDLHTHKERKGCVGGYVLYICICVYTHIYFLVLFTKSTNSNWKQKACVVFRALFLSIILFTKEKRLSLRNG